MNFHQGQTAVVQFLLEHGANVNDVHGPYDRTALHEAVFYGLIHFIECFSMKIYIRACV